MNVDANSRASAASLHIQQTPVLRASALFNERELAVTRLAASSSLRAQHVIDYLGPIAARRPLDPVLTGLLRTARGTVSRLAARRALAN